MGLSYRRLDPFRMPGIVSQISQHLGLVDYARFRGVNKTTFDYVRSTSIQNKRSDTLKWKIEKEASDRYTVWLSTFYRRRDSVKLTKFNYPPISNFAKLCEPIELRVMLNSHGYDRVHIKALLEGLLKNIPSYSVSKITISRRWDNPYWKLPPLMGPDDRVPFDGKLPSFGEIVEEFKNIGIELSRRKGCGGTCQSRNISILIPLKKYS